MLSMTGQFLIKDVALLGISVWTAADSLRATRRCRAPTAPTATASRSRADADSVATRRGLRPSWGNSELP